VLALAALAVVRFGLTLSLGAEYDTNANRAEIVAGAESPDTPEPSFVLRSTATGQLAWRKGINLLQVSGMLGGKLYLDPSVFDQDVLAGELAISERIRITRFFHVAMLGQYYDAGQLDVAPRRHRDFRNGTVRLRVHFVDPLGEAWLSGGYRGFQYKPDPYYDFQAGEAHAYAVARAHFGANEDHELDVAGAYHLERRFYSGIVQELDESLCPPGHGFMEGCLRAGTATRADWFHEGGIEVTYVGPLLVALGYATQLNLSNSFGESLLRQIITLKLAYRLPWSIYATVKAQLLVTRYLDPVLLDRLINSATFATIEDENRNSVVVDLERAIGSTGLSVNARYSVFTNELAPSVDSFLRQVVYLGLTYRVGAR
jgi:hypothetical protein